MNRTILPLLMISCLSLFSCRIDVKGDHGISAFSSIKASDHIVTENRNVTDFNSISVSSAIKVIVTDDNFNQQITIKGPDNVLEVLKTDVVDGQLKLRFDKPVNFVSKDVIVTIPHRKLRAIDVSGASSVVINHSMKVEQFVAELSGASKADLNLVSNKIQLNLSGASNININGNAQNLFADISGASKLNAKNLKVSDVKVDCSGASKAEVWAVDRLNADASGASKIVYANEANLSKEVSESGASNIVSL